MSTALLITGRLSRLAEQLGDLRGRLKQAARYEVAQVVGDTLAESAKMLICGSTRPPHEDEYDAGPWDDPWGEPFEDGPSRSHDRVDEPPQPDEPNDREFPIRSALLAGFAVARWSLTRTGQPTVAIGLASLAAIAVLILGDRVGPLLDVCASANELIDYPKRRP